MTPELEYAEEWRQVVGFEGYYEVSNLGRIRSVPRITTQGRQVGGYLRYFRLTRDGYARVKLRKDGRGAEPFVHRVVCEAFLGPKPAKMQIDHLDGDRLNNRLGNLRYATPLQNMRGAIARRGKWQVGEANASARLTGGDVAEIRRLYKEGMFQRDIGDRFGIHQAHVSKIILNKNWRIQPK